MDPRLNQEIVTVTKISAVNIIGRSTNASKIKSNKELYLLRIPVLKVSKYQQWKKLVQGLIPRFWFADSFILWLKSNFILFNPFFCFMNKEIEGPGSKVTPCDCFELDYCNTGQERAFLHCVKAKTSYKV